MKLKYLLLAISISSLADSPSQSPSQITYINLNTNCMELNQILEVLQKIKTQPSTYQTSKENLQTLGNSITNFIDKYKYWTPLTTVSFIYICFLYKIMNTNKLLNSDNYWCNWKPEIEFTQLLSMPQKDISTELINSIQKKYSDPQNPTNFVTPMVNFVNDTNQEIKDLESYIKIGKLLKRIKSTCAFPINEEKIKKAEEKINKLTYLKNIFTQWSIDFKQQQLNSINQNNTNKLPN